jgi:hypothetical protein
MEIILALLAIGLAGCWFWYRNKADNDTGKHDQSDSIDQAPYKIETPAEPPQVTSDPVPVKCGCGRSQSGLCVGLHKLTDEEWATHADNPKRTVAKKPAAKAKKPAAKKPAAKKPTAEKPAAAPAAPKKPRRTKQ